MTTRAPDATVAPGPSLARTRAGLGPWLWLALPAGAALLLWAPLYPALVWEWAEFPNLSHGFAIPLISGYLLWARRERLAALAPEPSLWGLPVLVAGLGALVAGARVEEPFVARLGLPVTLLGLSLFVGGRRVTRQTWAAIAYLAFMIPLPWATLKLITYRSRLLDAEVSAWGLGWLGVPVYRDGVMLHLPNITLEVADACSSIPAIAALLALGAAYASLARRPLLARVVLIGATLPLAITANIIRITTTAAGVYYLGPWTLRTTYHMFNGTVNFVFTFFLLLALDALLARWLGERRR